MNSAQESRGTFRRPEASVVGALLATLVASSGRVAEAAGAGAGAAVAQARGDLDATLNAGVEKSVRAANTAVEELKFAKVREKKDALQAILIVRNAADKKIGIRVEEDGSARAKVKIRVGCLATRCGR